MMTKLWKHHRHTATHGFALAILSTLRQKQALHTPTCFPGNNLPALQQDHRFAAIGRHQMAGRLTVKNGGLVAKTWRVWGWHGD